MHSTSPTGRDSSGNALLRVRRLFLYLGCLAFCLATTSDTTWGAELRTLDGRYIRIITDLPANAERDQWVACFDAAVPKWCEFWEVPLERVRDFRVTAHVMSSKAEFQRRGLIPNELPDFPHGFQYGDRTWVVQQASEYYTRHLILHEGVHALASFLFQGAGPPWFMEGTAELLATHRWDGEQVEVGIVPSDRSECPYWGRFKLLDQRRQAEETLSLFSVLQYSDTAHRQVEPYAWTWAAIQLLVHDEACRETVVAFGREGRDQTPQFTRRFVDALGKHWPVAQAKWRVLIDEFDYGFQLEQNQLGITGNEPYWNQEAWTLQVDADRGWQSTGKRFQTGDELIISASGSVQLDETTKPWVSRPDGITIAYHRAQPIGKLLVMVLPEVSKRAKTLEPLEIQAVGMGARVTIAQPSWVLFRVNDSAANLSNNSGFYEVKVTGSDLQ